MCGVIAALAAHGAPINAEQWNGTCWSDGFSFFVPKVTAGQIHFTGGTPHEGGYEFVLQSANDGSLVLQPAQAEFDFVSLHGTSKKGYKVTRETVQGQEALIVRDAKGNVTDVLTRINTDISEVIREDLRTFLDGEYVDMKGDIYRFYGNGTVQLPEDAAPAPYTIEEIYEIPCNVITTASGKHLFWKATAEGLELFRAVKGSDEEWDCGTAVATLLCHPRADVPVGGRWPETSTQLLTAGYFSSFSRDMLRLARNEIYARHGARFKSADLQSYFSSWPWYTPRVDAAAVKLSVVEQINVSLIQSLENDPDGWMK